MSPVHMSTGESPEAFVHRLSALASSSMDPLVPCAKRSKRPTNALLLTAPTLSQPAQAQAPYVSVSHSKLDLMRYEAGKLTSRATTSNLGRGWDSIPKARTWRLTTQWAWRKRCNNVRRQPPRLQIFVSNIGTRHERPSATIGSCLHRIS